MDIRNCSDGEIDGGQECARCEFLNWETKAQRREAPDGDELKRKRVSSVITNPQPITIQIINSCAKL